MVRLIGFPKVLLKDFVEKIIFKLIEENMKLFLKDENLTKKR